MGTPMALNLLRAGYGVTVFGRRPEAVAPLVEAGAVSAASAADVAAQSHVVVTMVTNTAAVESVVLGPRGILDGARPGTIVVDHSTIDPNATRAMSAALAERGVHMLDAPVSGGVIGAAAGTLVMMVGGALDVFERTRPVLEVNAARVLHMGESGAGQAAKACTQICVVVNMMGVAEAMLLGERLGVDPSRLIDALQGGFGASRILEVQGPKMVARAFDMEQRIESRLHDKDIHLALELARSVGLTFPASTAAAETFRRLQQAGGAALDSAAVMTVIGNGGTAGRAWTD